MVFCMELDLATNLLTSGNQAQREASARGLGRNLAAQGSGDWLLKFRRFAAKQQKVASTDYERGFIEALELVSVGFERQSTEGEESEQEMARIKTRAHWLATLRLLAKGLLRPLEISEKLKVHKSQITRLLDELEEAGLVTRKQEGKERHCRLTPRARALLGKLPDEPRVPAPGKLVAAVVRGVAAIHRDGRVGRSKLITSLERDVAEMAPQVLTLLGEALQNLALGFLDEEDALVATEGELRSRISGHLVLGCAGKKSALVEQLRALTGEGPILLRVGESFQEWDVLAAQQIPMLTILREKDLSQFVPPEESYSVIYESPSLLAEDRQTDRKGFIEEAQRRYCLSIEEAPALLNVQMLRVPLPELVG